jgi:hypothetical protein
MHSKHTLKSNSKGGERTSIKIEIIATLFNKVIEYNSTNLISTIKIKKREF